MHSIHITYTSYSYLTPRLLLMGSIDWKVLPSSIEEFLLNELLKSRLLANKSAVGGLSLIMMVCLGSCLRGGP